MNRILPYVLSLLFFSFLSLPDVTAQLPNNGLVAAWTFSGSAADASGNGHGGTVSGATPATDRFGQNGRAYAFDGQNDYIRVPHDTALNLRGTYSISVWVRVCTKSTPWDFDVVIGKPKNGDQTGSRGYGLTAAFTNTGFSGLFFFYRDIDYGWNVGTGNFSFESWHHVVLTGDPNPPSGTATSEIWLDGQKVGSMANPDGWGWTFNSNDLVIGGDPDSAGRYFSGDIDDIRIYNRVLSANEIGTLYGEGGWPITGGSYPRTPSISLIPLTDTVICRGEEIPVRVVTDGAQVDWKYSAYVRKSGDTAWLSPPATVTFRATALNTIASACPDTATDWADVTVIVRDPVVIDAGPPLYVCSGGTTVLGGQTSGGTPPYRWQWTPAVGLDDPTAEHPELIISGSGRYDVVVTDASGCRDTASVSINVLQSPSVTLGTDTLHFCRNGLPVSLRPEVTGGSPPYSFTWEGPEVASDTAEELLLNPTEPATYIVAVSDVVGCTTRDTITLIPDQAPVADAGADRTFCPDESFRIGTEGEAGFEYRWSPATALSDPASPNPEVSALDSSMTYTLEVTDRSTGCSTLDTIHLELHDILLEFSEERLDFGELDGCTSSKTMTVLLRNRGTTEAMLDEVTISGTPFFILSPTSQQSIPAGGEIELEIHFLPTQPGEVTGTLVAVSAGCSMTLELELSGTKGEMLFSLDRSVLDFGEVPGSIGSQADSTITLRNEGTDDLLITSVQLADPFSLIAPSLPISIRPGDSVQLLIRFTPTTAGSFTTTMQIGFRSGPCTDTLRAEISGRRSVSSVDEGERVVPDELDLTGGHDGKTFCRWSLHFPAGPSARRSADLSRPPQARVQRAWGGRSAAADRRGPPEEEPGTSVGDNHRTASTAISGGPLRPASAERAAGHLPTSGEENKVPG